MTLTLEQVKERALTKHDWTYADFASLPAESRFELYDGNLFMSPSPVRAHQALLLRIGKLLDDFVQQRSLGEVLVAPFDVILSNRRVLQPDVLVVLSKHLDRISSAGVNGAPDLVVEVLSPSTIRYDRTTKFRFYEEAGVQEYWMVDPATKSVEIYGIAATGDFPGKYDMLYNADRPSYRWSEVLSGLSFEQEDLFKNIPTL